MFYFIITILFWLPSLYVKSIYRMVIHWNVYFEQLRIRAYDNFYPDNVADANVSITVTRNPAGPLFSKDEYVSTINEYHPFGVSIDSLSAGDADGVSSLS